MGLLPNLSDIKELHAVEPGEYDLRITKAMTQDYDSGAKSLTLILEVVGEDTSDDIWHKLWLPVATDTDKKANNKLRMIKDFVDGIGLDSSADLEAEDFKGVTFSGYLDQEPDFRNPEKVNNILVRTT